MVHKPCLFILATIGVSIVISLGLAADLQYNGPEPCLKKGVDGATEDDCGATVALSNLFYVANWPNVTKGYDPSSPQSKLADNWAMVKSKE